MFTSESEVQTGHVTTVAYGSDTWCRWSDNTATTTTTTTTTLTTSTTSVNIHYTDHHYTEVDHYLERGSHSRPR